MEIDIYQPCPCHSGKKIKFCCGKDIVGDLAQIISLSQGRQSKTSLEHIDRVVERVGPRDCLTTIKTHVLISLREFDEAKRINDEFVAKHPGHTIGLANQALIFAGLGDVGEALSALQDAMESISGTEVPVSLANAYRIIGILLLTSGHVFAARAHLHLALRFSARNTESIQSMLLESYSIPGIPSMLRHDPGIPLPPTDTEWSERYSRIRDAAHEGLWRKAIAAFASLHQQYPDAGEITTSLAVVSGWLADEESSVKYWRQIANDENTPVNIAVESELYAQLLDSADAGNTIDIVELSYGITDVDSLLESATDNQQLISAVAQPTDAENAAPPPKAAFAMLDRPAVNDAQGLAFDNIPSIVGQLLIYGKQTDRPARLKVTLTADGAIDAHRNLIQDSLGNWLEPDPLTEVVGKTTQVAQAMHWEWYLPDDVTTEQYQALTSEKRRDVLLNRWTRAPMPQLAGHTPEEAAGKTEFRIPLLALIAQMELSPDAQFHNSGIHDELKSNLNLPAEWDPEKLVDHSIPSPFRLNMVDVEGLDDDQLLLVYPHSLSIGLISLSRRAALELVKRDHLDEKVGFEQVYLYLARTAHDNEQAEKYFQLARQHASAHERPLGRLLVREFETRIERGMTEECDQLMQLIRSRHLSEPNVELDLLRVLQRFGLISADGQTMMSPEAAPPPQPAADETGAIWTPESASSVPAGEDKGKIWIPE